MSELIISVKEARKLLGKEYENLTDDEVADTINQLHRLAKLSLDVARERLADEKHTKKAGQS